MIRIRFKGSLCCLRPTVSQALDGAPLGSCEVILTLNNKHALFGRGADGQRPLFRRKYPETFDTFCDCDKTVRLAGLAARWRLASRHSHRIKNPGRVAPLARLMKTSHLKEFALRKIAIDSHALISALPLACPTRPGSALTAKLIGAATFLSGQAKLREGAAHLVALARSIALSVSRLAELLLRRVPASSRSA